MSAMHEAAPLTDGRYDAFVVDPQARDNKFALSLTITTGPNKGAVIDLIAAHRARDEVMLIGLPYTLVVEAGAPRVEW